MIHTLVKDSQFLCTFMSINFTQYVLLCIVCVTYVCTYVDNQIADLASINELLTKYCTQWRGIGLDLGLEESLLNSIELDHATQRERFEKTMKMWLRKDQDEATWGVLELAVTNANRAELSYDKLLKCT